MYSSRGLQSRSCHLLGPLDLRSLFQSNSKVGSGMGERLEGIPVGTRASDQGRACVNRLGEMSLGDYNLSAALPQISLPSSERRVEGGGRESGRAGSLQRWRLRGGRSSASRAKRRRFGSKAEEAHGRIGLVQLATAYGGHCRGLEGFRVVCTKSKTSVNKY